MANSGKKVIWSAPEFEYNPKTSTWHIPSLVGAGLIFLLALWQKNLMFGIFIILAEVMFLHWGRQHPKRMTFTLDDDGLSISNIKQYPYEAFQGFHIVERHTPELIFKTHNKLNPYVRVLLARDEIKIIKEYLLIHLKEVSYEESSAKHIARMLGF
ncbi:MAG: hypothetical protein Q8R26_01915 [bacterium]|nr:hypothetical protein [bacterium]